MDRKIYEMLLDCFHAKWIIRDWPNHEKVVAKIDEELLYSIYNKNYFRSKATIYLIVEVDQNTSYKYRYTFSDRPDVFAEDLTWVVGREALEFLDKNLFGIVHDVLKKKKVLLSGSYTKKTLQQMSKFARCLGYNEIIWFTPTSENTHIDRDYWRKVYNTMLDEDLNAVFMFIGRKQSMPTIFGTVEKMANTLGIPVYRKEDYEEMVLQKIGGDAQNDTESDNDGNGDNDGLNGEFKQCTGYDISYTNH